MAETTLPPKPEKLALSYLRRIDGRLDTIEQKLDEVATQMASLENRFAGVHREVATMNILLYDLDHRITRIEGLFDLDDTAASGEL